MNILFIKHFLYRIYGFESVRILALSVFGYFPLLYIFIIDIIIFIK